MKASKQIGETIKKFEGLRLMPYRCAGGVWTVGYGHTGSDFDVHRPISAASATSFFDSDLVKVETQLSGLIDESNVALTQGQFDALVSFVFNLGIGALKSSTLWRKIKSNPTDPTIPDEFGRWVHAKGVRLPGLVKRRAEEAKVWRGN